METFALCNVLVNDLTDLRWCHINNTGLVFYEHEAFQDWYLTFIMSILPAAATMVYMMMWAFPCMVARISWCHCKPGLCYSFTLQTKKEVMPLTRKKSEGNKYEPWVVTINKKWCKYHP